MSDLNWYIVHVPGSITRAMEFLKLYRVPVYYPMLETYKATPLRHLSKAQRKSGVKLATPHRVPLFPKYLFIELDYERPWRSSFYSAGIRGLVSERSADEIDAGVKAGEALRPVRVPGAVIRALKLEERKNGGALPGKMPAELLFSVGQAVRITEGPLAGRVAELLSVPDKPIEQFDSKDRIAVGVSAFGRVLDVDLTIAQIEKVTV